MIKQITLNTKCKKKKKPSNTEDHDDDDQDEDEDCSDDDKENENDQEDSWPAQAFSTIHQIVWLDENTCFSTKREKHIKICDKPNSKDLLKCLQRLTNNQLFYKKTVHIKPENLLVQFNKLVEAVFGKDFLYKFTTQNCLNKDESTSNKSGSTASETANHDVINDLNKVCDINNLPSKLLGEHAKVLGLCQLVLFIIKEFKDKFEEYQKMVRENKISFDCLHLHFGNGQTI